MEKVNIPLHAPAIGCLEFAELFRLRFVFVDCERFVDEQVPDLFAALPRIERLVLRVTHPAKRSVDSWRLRSVTLADELDQSAALIDFLAQNFAQIAAFQPENFLPDRLVAEKREGVCDELPRAPQFAADRRNEDCGSG